MSAVYGHDVGHAMYFCPNWVNLNCNCNWESETTTWLQDEVKTPLEIQTDTNGQILCVWHSTDCLNTTEKRECFHIVTLC